MEELSRHELKIKHRQLANTVEDLKKATQETYSLLRELNDSYIASKASFPLWRYGKLKQMIKKATTKEHLEQLEQWVKYSDPESRDDSPRPPTKGDESNKVDSDRPLVSGGKPLNLLEQMVRKVEKFCGLDDDEIQDEDVMSNEDLHRKIEGKKAGIRTLHRKLSEAYTALTGLKESYQESKSLLRLRRYFALKEMIRATVSATKPGSSYEE